MPTDPNKFEYVLSRTCVFVTVGGLKVASSQESCIIFLQEASPSSSLMCSTFGDLI